MPIIAEIEQREPTANHLNTLVLTRCQIQLGQEEPVFLPPGTVINLADATYPAAMEALTENELEQILADAQSVKFPDLVNINVDIDYETGPRPIVKTDNPGAVIILVTLLDLHRGKPIHLVEKTRKVKKPTTNHLLFEGKAPTDGKFGVDITGAEIIATHALSISAKAQQYPVAA